MALITEYPLWLIIVCIGFGAAYAFFLYYHRERHLTEVSPAVKRWMAAARFVFVTLLSFLLLTPLIKTIRRTVEKPVIVIAQDNSESILLNRDSVFYKTGYLSALRKMAETLGEKYDVKIYSAGDRVKEGLPGSFRDKQTELSSLFTEIQNRFVNRNLGAVVLASDGIYNMGSNPYYSMERLRVPVYTVAMGDTSVRRDLVISRVNYNRTAYLGNNMPVQVVIDADKCKGESFTLTVEKDNQVLFSKSIDIGVNGFHTTVPVVLEAKNKGINHYRIRVSHLSGEVTLVNNTRDIFVEVLENREKILLLYNGAHPDIGALKNALLSTENYDLQIVNVQDFKGGINGYNLVILHQLPSLSNPAAGITAAIRQAKIPVLYILGAQSNLKAFNSMQSSVRVESASGKITEALPFAEDNFSLFTLSEEARKASGEFPPLIVPFGIYRNSSGGTNLFTQQIGSVNSGQPLICFSDMDGSRSGVIAGEGIWRWRLRDYALNESFSRFDELILKIIQYLSVKEEKKHLRILSKNNFLENEPVRMDAEVYNESYELVNEPEINLVITGRGNKTFPFVFTKTEKTYTLNAGFFPVGRYSYSATVKSGSKTYSETGEFTVSQLQLEEVETTADHQLLFRMAAESGGKMYYPAQLAALEKDLLARDDIKALSYSESNLEDLINSKWLLILLVLFISLEWFMRKRNGAY